MLNSENKLTPDSKYILLNSSANRSLDHSVLTNLYLPIIGRGALELYELLWSLSINDHNRLILHKHYELQSMLDVGSDKLLRYRRKLEGVNLLKTFISLTSADSYVYELKVPCSASEFLKTDVLSILLLGKVGEETYNQIVARLFLPKPDVGKVKDVSASLLDVFQVPSSDLKSLPGSVNEAKRTISNRQNSADVSRLTSRAHDFDFDLLLDILDNSYVDLTSVKAASDLIMSEYELYGIDELKMADFIKRATNLNTNKLIQRNLKFIINRDYTQPNVTDRLQAPQNTQSATETGKQADSLPKDRELQEVIDIAKTNAPIALLKQIKDQRHGMVTEGEQRAVRDLVARGIFPTEVINMLIYYLLADDQHSTLNKNLMATIADDWAQHHVATAEDAVSQLQERVKKQEAARTKRQNRRYSGGRGQIKETLPDWAKADQPGSATSKKAAAQSTNKKKSKAQQALEHKRVDEALARLRQKKDDQ